MPDELLDQSAECLEVLHATLDGAKLEGDENTFHVAQAGALLSRAVFLSGAALDLARTDRRPAAAVLLRPAIECWIDCCYVLYCKAPAVLQLYFMGLLQRRRIGKAWLGEQPIDEIEEQLRELDKVVAIGEEAGMLSSDFKLRKNFPVDQRLDAAIACRGAAPSYRHIYDYLYRGLSTSEIHTSVAIDFHAEYTEDVAAFKVSPNEAFPVPLLVGLATGLTCTAGRDVLIALGLGVERLDRCTAPLHEHLSIAMNSVRERLADDPTPEVVRALELLGQRDSEP